MKTIFITLLVVLISGCATGPQAGCDAMCMRASQNASVQPRWHTDTKPIVIRDAATGRVVYRVSR
jgi:hypothetical protein